MSHHQLLPELFAERAHATPDAVAVVAAERSITYRELLDRARRVAGAVRREGGGRDKVVGLACGRGIDGLTGLLGTMLAGAAYLYLDPAWPAARLRHMARECRIRLTLTDARPVSAGTRTLTIAAAARGPAAPEGSWARAHDLCYVVYTSGSTGTPKGVAVEHGGAANMARQLAIAFGVRPGVRVLQFASWAWDAAACEILVTLAAGGTLVLAPDAARAGGEGLAAVLRDAQVQVATLTPSLLAALPAAELPALSTVVAVGERCPPELVARWATGRTFINGYGPTEATVAVSVGTCRPGEPVTIGAPLPGVLVRVVDEEDRPVPAGEPGELVVGGVGVARGYVTAAPEGYRGRGPLVQPRDRFSVVGCVRWYRTGDLVRQEPDGDRLYYLGRVDDQVKVRGYRVELAEVEQGLRRHPGVRECAVVSTGNRLVAYVVPVGPDWSTGELLAAAAGWLPDFMLPSEVRVVEALPLTANGKLDRRALADAATSAQAKPRGVADEVLDLVRQALETEVGPDDDVFDAGGHSLVAAQLAVALTERFGVPVAALHVYDHPTAAGLATLITELVPLRKVA